MASGDSCSAHNDSCSDITELGCQGKGRLPLMDHLRRDKARFMFQLSDVSACYAFPRYSKDWVSK